MEPEPTAARGLDCAAAGVDTIVPRFYSENDELLNNPPDVIPCSRTSAKIDGLPPRHNCSLWVTAENDSGVVLYQGEDIGFDLVAGQVTNGYEIPMRACAAEECDDGIDNDCDREIDCSDSDCTGDFPCTQSMVLLPSGCFDMGDAFAEGDNNELPPHTVCITSSFYMDAHEVTNAEYAVCVSAGGCTAPGASNSNTRDAYYGNPIYDDYPVIYVNWTHANDYCAWAGKRLPTEAEWEYAARGGLSGKRYPWGDTISTADANYCDACNLVDSDTSPVENYASNGYGLFDMAGNVAEWVNDWYQADYYSVSPADDPPGPVSGTSRVKRGGAWSEGSFNNRVAFRAGNTPDLHQHHGGFRCARD